MDKQVENTLSVHVLASGSKGNSALVCYRNTTIIIDVGISARRITEGLKHIGKRPEEVSGILITHEHSDHVSGLAQLLKQYRLPVYCKEKTWKAMGEKISPFRKHLFPLTRHILDIGELNIESFDIHHDAVSPVGFSCFGGSEKVSFMTDTGHIDDEILGHLDESTMLVLEANHDLDMLLRGNYPPILKKRVSGPKGHLNNDDTARTILTMRRAPNMQVVLAHRSEQNNTESLVEMTVTEILRRSDIEVGKDVILRHGSPYTCISMSSKGV